MSSPASPACQTAGTADLVIGNHAVYPIEGTGRYPRHSVTVSTSAQKFSIGVSGPISWLDPHT